VAAGRLHFTTDFAESAKHGEVQFIAVGTPPDEDGSADLKYVLAVAAEIGRHMQKQIVVVTKSTVPVSTAEKVRKALQTELTQRGSALPFFVASNPEFLKEGAAIEDFMKPDRIVVGTDSSEAEEVMRKLYKPFLLNGHPIIFMDIPSAEMTKYAANAMLATKISFMNDVANLCELMGADVNMVRKGIGSDGRIGTKFIYPGVGYGGSCFPKDVRALSHMAEDSGLDLSIIKATQTVNDRQRSLLGRRIVKRFGEDLAGMQFAVWGLAFKPGTDDMREAPSVELINELLGRGARVRAFDPVAMQRAADIWGKQAGFELCKDPMAAAEGSDALIVVTEWHEFRSPDFAQLTKLLRQPVIMDGRNLYEPRMMAELGFDYTGIGRSARAQALEADEARESTAR
jgi:UDPglucose 6-dehydrogenase